VVQQFKICYAQNIYFFLNIHFSALWTLLPREGRIIHPPPPPNPSYAPNVTTQVVDEITLQNLRYVSLEVLSSLIRLADEQIIGHNLNVASTLNQSISRREQRKDEINWLTDDRNSSLGGQPSFFVFGRSRVQISTRTPVILFYIAIAVFAWCVIKQE
jgi:hypothetical protein